MDLETAFLQAIAAAPADDTSRLVYADWLDDQGHALRARFIREQCAPGAQEVPHIADPGLIAWEEVLPRLGVWGFRRGIPDAVTSSSVPEFLSRAELMSAIPTVRTLTFDYKNITGYYYEKERYPFEEARTLSPPECEALAVCPALGQVERLGVQNASLTALGVLLASPHLTRLHTLDFAGTALPVGSIRVLVQSQVAPRLVELRLRANRFGVGDYFHSFSYPPTVDEAGIAVLANAPSLAQLEVLDLANNLLGDDAADALIRSICLLRLRVLDLNATVPGPTEGSGQPLSARAIHRLRARFPDVRVDVTRYWS